MGRFKLTALTEDRQFFEKMIGDLNLIVVKDLDGFRANDPTFGIMEPSVVRTLGFCEFGCYRYPSTMGDVIMKAYGDAPDALMVGLVKRKRELTFDPTSTRKYVEVSLGDFQELMDLRKSAGDPMYLKDNYIVFVIFADLAGFQTAVTDGLITKLVVDGVEYTGAGLLSIGAGIIGQLEFIVVRDIDGF
jgi:hypothetical protein